MGRRAASFCEVERVKTGRVRKIFLLRGRRLYYLFLFFFTLAIWVAPFQSVFLHICSFGIIAFNLDSTLASIYTCSNLLWCLTASSLSAILLIRYDRNLKSFVRVASVWSFSLIFSDVFVGGIIPTLSSTILANLVFMFNFASDLFGGLIGGLLATKLLRYAHPWTRFHTRMLTNNVIVSKNTKPFKVFLFVDAGALATGYTGISLISFYWVWLVGGLICALVAYYKISIIVRAIEITHLYGWPFFHWKQVLLLLGVFFGYIPILLFIRFATESVFSCDRHACRMLFGASLVAFLFLTSYLLYSEPQRARSVSFFENAALLGLSSVGFWYGFRFRRASVRSGRPLKVNKHLFRFVRLMRLTPLGTPFREWVRAAHRPMSVLQSILSKPQSGPINEKLIKLTASSVKITFLTSFPIFWYYHLPITDIGHRLAEYTFLILSLVLGGVVYHFVYRLFSKPSNLFNTMSIYAVPQLIFMPLISALSIVALNFQYANLRLIRAEHLHRFAIFHSILSLQFVQSPTSRLMKLTTFSEGVIIGVIQLLFLEAYYQFYKADRHASYAVGILAGFANALALLVMVSPVRDMVYYYMLQ